MRLVIHGQQAFGKAVLERLIERGDNVVGVFCAPDKEGRPLDPLKECALENGLTVHQPISWKTDEALELKILQARPLRNGLCNIICFPRGN